MISIAIRIRLGEWSAWDLAAIAVNFVAWPLQEWVLHVCVLHCKPVTVWGRSYEFRIPRIHRAHHRDPWNYDILFIPLHAFLYIFPLNLLLWLVVAPSVPVAFTGSTLALVLTLHYEWIHFLIHTRVSPRTRFYQRLWRNHRLHHFKNEHYWYGGDAPRGRPPARHRPAARRGAAVTDGTHAHRGGAVSEYGVGPARQTAPGCASPARAACPP